MMVGIKIDLCTSPPLCTEIRLTIKAAGTHACMYTRMPAALPIAMRSLAKIEVIM